MKNVLHVFIWALLTAPTLAAASDQSLVSRVAGGAISVPEPSPLALLLIGVAGLIIGRRASRNRHSNDEGLDD
jgi:PEP-CTERM motif